MNKGSSPNDFIVGTLLNSVVNFTKGPTGFINPKDIVVEYDPVARTIKLSGEVRAFFRGRVIRVIRDGWTSEPHPNSLGRWYLYYDGQEVKWSQSIWTYDFLQIAYVYHGSSAKFAIKETHGFIPHEAHDIFHNTVGSYRKSGGDFSGYVLNSSTPADRRPLVSALTFQDEDLINVLPAITAESYTRVSYTGTGQASFTLSATDIVPVTGGIPYWNQFNGATWIQTPMSVGKYMSIWLVAIPTTSDSTSLPYRFCWIQGQSEGTLVEQQALSPINVYLENIAAEYVFTNKVIIQYIGGVWKIVEVSTLFGTRVNQRVVPLGNYLSSVSTDGITITGDGTPGNPIRLV